MNLLRKFSFLIEPGVLPRKKEHPQEFNKDHLDFKFEIKKPKLQKTKPFELSSKPSRDYPLINPDSISWENRMKRKVTAESGDSGNFWILFLGNPSCNCWAHNSVLAVQPLCNSTTVYLVVIEFFGV